KNKKLLFGLFATGAALAATHILSARTATRKPDAQAPSYDFIDAFIEEQMQKLSIPGLSLAIVEGDQIVHLRGFGHARPGGEIPNPQTPFFIGSVTKSITALAVMQLVEAGKVELEAPVRQYLPWFRLADSEASGRITVHHLLNHASGLSVMQGQVILTEMDDRPDATECQLRALSTEKLSNPPGTKFQYNNTNYNLLGSIIEAASGETYSGYIQRHIFDPLEMSHSYTSRTVAQQNGLAMGHRYWFGHPVPAPNLTIPIGSLPSGQIISCAEDMAHFLITQINGGRYGDAQILSSSGMDEMHRGTAEIVEMGMSLGSYAMGWESQVTGKTTIISHSGIVPDFGACAALIPEQKKAIVLLYNANHAMIKMTFDEFGLGAAERLAGERPSKTMLGWTPWLMRSMLLIPILQFVRVLATLKRLERWRSNPEARPSHGRMWRQYILLPLVPNLLVALTLVPMLSKMRGWIQLFMPDFSWIARISGGFAVIWTFLRTGLMMQHLNKPRH
ncbi:MAG TPA: serine hydrolase domain-containing protein, partial [Anaerolineales bacterium]